MTKYSNQITNLQRLTLVTAIGTGLAANDLHAATIVVTSTSDAPTNSVSQDCLLRDALETAASGIDQGGCTITGDSNSGTLQIDMSELSGDLQLAHGQIEYQGQDRSISLVGPGQDTLVIRADTESRAMAFDGGANDFRLALTGLSFSDGNIDGDGGALRFIGRELSLTDVRISGNTASGKGGGLSANLIVEDVEALPDRQTLNLTIASSKISGNQSGDDGGGVYAYLNAEESSGTDLRLTITDSIIENNVADNSSGGGVYARLRNKYGNEDSLEVLITGNRFDGNQGFNGGGLELRMTARDAIMKGPFTEISNNVFFGNQAEQTGGGLRLNSGWENDESDEIGRQAKHVLAHNQFEANVARSAGGAFISSLVNQVPAAELIIESHGNSFIDNQAQRNAGLLISGRLVNASVSEPSPFNSVDLTSRNDRFRGNRAEVPSANGTNSAGAALLVVENRRPGGAAGPARLSIENTTAIDNYSADGIGAFNIDSRITEESELMIHGSTWSGNEALGQTGALNINGFETVTLINSTISGNRAGADGGGLMIRESDDITIRHATITDNEAGASGGGIFVSEAVSLAFDHVVLAGNLAEKGSSELDNEDSATASVRFSLIEDPDGADVDSVEGNIFGQAHRLEPLADNGGPTPTRHPQPNSPVINSGESDPGPDSPEHDQRGPGFPRVVGPSADIGAIEFLGLFRDRFEAH